MNLASFDLNLLKAADALFDECSVTRAAERTGITQQAMSGQLRRLREIFDDQLLQQSGRGLLRTSLADALRQPIRDALLRIERALVVKPVFDPATSKRTFSATALNYAGSTILPDVCRSVRAKAPRTAVSVRPLDARFVKDLDEARTDICMCNAFWRVTHGASVEDVRIMTLFEDDYVCVVDPAFHPDETVTLERYLSAAHAIVDLGANGPTSLETAWIRHCFQPRVGVIQPNFVDVLFMIPGTELIAVVQRQIARRWAPPLGLALRPVPFEVEPVRLEMIWHPRDDDEPGHRFLRNEVEAAARTIREVRAQDRSTASA